MVSLASVIITGEKNLYHFLITFPPSQAQLKANQVSLLEIAEPADVAVLRSYVNIASTIGLSGGGPLGGFLAESIGWRW